ncbi:MAG: hypothetical protein PHF29_02390 [Candidatus Riflebacteria bacterium]|nr:hypothetical protein [Candidatus Riflebacteria bacterium]
MKNYLLKSVCRQCQASVSSTSHVCPLCGISRPVFDNLTPIEKEYLNRAPAIPAKFYYMPSNVNPRGNLIVNLTSEFKRYLADFSSSQNFYIASLVMIICGTMVISGTGFPFSFIAFWPALLYIIYDFISLFRAVTVSLLVSRLQLRGGASPYSVHFKIEDQLGKMFSGLQMILTSFFDKNWLTMGQSEKMSFDNFYQAIKTLTTRIKKFARISLETTAIIWRNNVYAIVAQDKVSFQDKIVSINNKIREGEAIILRYCWMQHLDTIADSLKSFVYSPEEQTQEAFRREMIEGNQLGGHGPLHEPYQEGFQNVPMELSFKMRYFWHEQLMPAPLPSEEIIKKYPETREFFESILQVRQLKESLEQQMILDCATNALGNIGGGSDTTALEAADIKHYELYSQCLDIPKFQPDSDSLQNQIDRLNSQLKV